MSLRADVIGLVVGDMTSTLAFYRRLGFVIPLSADAQPHVEVALPGGLRLCFDTKEVVASFDPDFDPVARNAGVSIGFAADSPAEVDSTFADLVTAGYDGYLAPWDAVWGQRYAAVRDPDGVSVDLFAALGV